MAYRSSQGQASTLLVHASDGSGEEKQPGAIHADVVQASDWSPDGHYLALELTKFQGRENWKDSLRVVEADRGKLVAIGNVSDGKFSPDGHWLAYDDETSGELYVTPFPGPGARIAVSSKGGGDSRWRGDGQELFYGADDLTIISVQVRESANEFHVLSSQPLFKLQLPNCRLL